MTEIDNKNKDSVTFVIFGATGDLAENKLLPAIFDLRKGGFLTADFKVVGFSRKDLTHEDYRQFVRNALENKSKEVDEQLLENIYYQRGDLHDIETYKNLAKFLNELDSGPGENLDHCSNKLFYLAVPPSLYDSVFTNLSESGLTLPCNDFESNQNFWTRVLVEKPFGHDLKQAQDLDQKLGKLFAEEQIFRIDHYLAKETLQNILTFRFANSIFQPIWNADSISKIEIILHESKDVSNRGAFYDKVGALRDVGQNHLLQMLALVTMKDPQSLDAKSIRESRVDVLNKLRIYSDKSDSSESSPNSFFRSQYEGYLEHDGVDSESNTETAFRVGISIDDGEWENVPIYIESGKAISESRAEILIYFKEKESAFCSPDDGVDTENILKFRIQPDEGISINFWTKRPGFDYRLENKKLRFNYESDTSERLPDAYERVLYDCIRGDQTLFLDTREVLAQWSIISEIIEKWQNIPLGKYEVGDSDIFKIKK